MDLGSRRLRTAGARGSQLTTPATPTPGEKPRSKCLPEASARSVDSTATEPIVGVDGQPLRDRGRFRQFTLRDCTRETILRTNARYLLKHGIHAGDFGWLWGPSTIGKTAKALDLAAHILLGQPWHGMRTRGGTLFVAYVAGESGEGIRKRLAGLSMKFPDLPEDGFLVIPEAVLLDDPDQTEELSAQIERFDTDTGRALGLIVFDTFRTCSGGEEDRSETTAAAKRHARNLMAKHPAAATLCVHHPGHKNTARGRGTSDQFASAEFVIGMEWEGDTNEQTAPDQKLTRTTFLKVKEGANGSSHVAGLEILELGVDDDGDQVTTILEVPRSCSAPAKKRYKPQKGSFPDRILSAYGALVGKDVPSDQASEVPVYKRPAGSTLKGVEKQAVFEEAFAANLKEVEFLYPASDEAGGEERRLRKQFSNSLGRLESEGVIGTSKEYMWRLF